MSSRKNKQPEKEVDQESKNRINETLDAVIKEALASSQFDSFYKKKAGEIRSLDEACFQVLAKRFQKASHDEKDVIVHLLKHFPGVEHIQFLQNFIRRESFLPRTGLLMLELFNKSDAMLEDGVASKLLDLDSLAQRLNHGIMQGSIDDSLISEFLRMDEQDSEGIRVQLLEETGVKFSVFISKMLATDAKRGERIALSVARLADQASYKLLEDVYAKTGSKDIAKTLKKMAHTLKQKGIPVELPAQEEKQEPVFKGAVLPEPRCFISTVDAEGCRIIFMIKPVTMYETKIFNIMLSDQKGIHSIEVITSMRKETRIFINRLLADTKVEFLETQTDYGAFLVAEACRITEEKGTTVSANIAQWNKVFGDVLGTRTQPLIYDCIRKDAIPINADPAATAKALLDATYIAFWFVVTQEARECWMKLTNILYSPLVVSNEQKKERIEQFIVETVRQFFTEARCKVFKRRLEELSYFLYKKEKEELACFALAVAEAFASPELQPENNKFCCEMIRKGFALFEAAYKKKGGAQGGMSADPDSVSLIA